MDIYNKTFLESSDNGLIEEALREFVLANAGGKFLRASLVALGYQTFGKNDNYYLPLALALEVFQTSILIHDDIIDRADKRRGKNTIPVNYKNIYNDPIILKDDFDDKRNNMASSMALCLGDLGFYLANGIILDNYKQDKRLSLILKYYNAVVIKTCHGEMLDVMLPFFEEFYGKSNNLEDQVIEIAKLKTAWYSVIGPYCLGAILGGLEMDRVYELEDALISLGVAFQIKDDLLGIYGDEKVIGKSVLSDITEYKQTILYAYTINTEYKDELLNFYGKDIKSEEALKIREIFDKSGAKKYALEVMDKLFENSIINIKSLNFIDDDKKNILLGFAEYLKGRNK